jgi:diguanylate cyclase
MNITRELPFDGSLRKRRIYLILLALGGLGGAVSFAHALFSGTLEVEVVAATAGTAVVCGLLAVLTASKRVPLQRLERTVLAVGALVVAGVLWYGLYAAPPDAGIRAGSFAALLWVPILFVFCAIAFDGITSLRYSMAIYVVVVALTLPHALGTLGSTSLGDGLFFPLQAYLAYAVLIAALYFFADIRQRAFTMEEAARTMRRLANTDALTGLANRRQAEEQLTRELRRAERYGRPFSVLVMDIDHFKALNDRHGHLAGDDVLVDLARRIERMVRAADTIARWGGEEFLLIAPETVADDAARVADMIRRHIDENAMADRYRMTISIGVASYRPGDTVQSIIARADAALYLAKRAGRNQVKMEIVPTTPV